MAQECQHQQLDSLILHNVIILIWVSDILTGLTSHFGTRPFVSMRVIPASAFLVVFLGTEGCCRKCRNSAYIEQERKKKTHEIREGNSALGGMWALCPKYGGNHLPLASATRSTFSDFNNKITPPWATLSARRHSSCDLTRSYSLPSQGNQYIFCSPLNCTSVILGKWESRPPYGAFGSSQWRREGDWAVPPYHSRVQVRSQASPGSCISYWCGSEANPM